MNFIKSFIMVMVLVTILNIIINKNSKYLKKEVRWQHYLFGYFFMLYLIINLAMVGLPTLSEWKYSLSLNQSIFNPHINLVPFKDGIEITSILNIILFMPFGFLLPALWKKYRNFWTTFYYGAFFSLIIEIGQLFTRYRSSDIDDLIFNTIGTICGWLIFNIMRKIFHKLANKIVVEILPGDTLAIKLESYLYIGIVIICFFFLC